MQDNNLFVLVTTSSKTTLDTMGFSDCFSSSLYVQNITQTEEVQSQSISLFSL